ncbi:hypothetical protein EDB83DRAFT_2537158 [Lactarius deliciosus]|nr:hypothetical protein EDB83DRAFT_2537158 [Lactarius deliciosus]
MFKPLSSTHGVSSLLSTHEIKWRDRQLFLESKGYMLRPRLRPGWTPSWISAGQHYEFFEDSTRLPLRPLLVDATRISDDKLVCIKEVKTGDQETRIALTLSEIDDPANHSVPILDNFVDPVNKSISYLVMPFLRLSDDPTFGVVEEVVDWADQVLEGLAFMHSCGVAHRDSSFKNILMDATRMFPRGFHPVRDVFLPHDILAPAPVIPRLDVGVRYYFVDYRISSYFLEGERQLVFGFAGRDRDVPELSDEVPYDPFKVDIFTIGNVMRREFVGNYSNLSFFIPVIEAMTQSDPSIRPSAELALQQWRTIRGRINILHRFWSIDSTFRQDARQEIASHIFWDLSVDVCLPRLGVSANDIIITDRLICIHNLFFEILTPQARRDAQFDARPFVGALKMSDGFTSPRVNAARIKDYQGSGHPVRVTGKVLNFSDDETHLVMEASDGGHVKVLLPAPPQPHNVTDTFVESIGTVVDASTIKFMACINMGSKLDLALVNQVVELTFDPKFRGRLF